MWQISYSPANGASLGSSFCVKKFDFSLKTLPKSGQNKDEFFDIIYFFFQIICYLPSCFARRGIKLGINLPNIGSKCCCFGPLSRPSRPLYGQIKNFETCVFAIDVLIFFSQFCSASPEIIGVKVCHRRTDRQIL